MKKIILSLIILFMVNNLLAKKIAYEVSTNVFKEANSVYRLGRQNLRLKFDVKNVKSIKWYQIIPDISKFYNNANFPWNPNPYQWKGFDKINYKRVEIESFRDKKIVTITNEILEKNRQDGNYFYNSELGSFWFEVVAELKNGKIIKSAGLSKNSSRGLSPKVFRLSYLASYDYIGYLITFFNVPGIFGSIPYQSKNYIGVDCADVLMATSAIMNKTKLKDYNVAMLTKKLKTQAIVRIKNGRPTQTLKWGIDFKRGDFIAVRYSSKSQFAHIGLLYNDSNKNGILDEEDWIIHAGPDALHVSKLNSNGVFDGFVKILKNKDMK